MLIVDAHCDTALSVYKNNGDLYENQFQLDIKRLKGIGRCVQFFAAFAHPHDYRNDTLTRVLSILDVVYEAQQEHGDVFAVCTSADDIKGAFRRKNSSNSFGGGRGMPQWRIGCTQTTVQAGCQEHASDLELPQYAG